jgi:hypothetical protein
MIANMSLPTQFTILNILLNTKKVVNPVWTSNKNINVKITERV